MMSVTNQENASTLTHTHACFAADLLCNQQRIIMRTRINKAFYALEDDECAECGNKLDDNDDCAWCGHYRNR